MLNSAKYCPNSWSVGRLFFPAQGRLWYPTKLNVSVQSPFCLLYRHSMSITTLLLASVEWGECYWKLEIRPRSTPLSWIVLFPPHPVHLLLQILRDWSFDCESWWWYVAVLWECGLGTSLITNFGVIQGSVGGWLLELIRCIFHRMFMWLDIGPV